MGSDHVTSSYISEKGDLSYKYQRLRERLRTAVKNGELSGKLPGERELARRYAANAKTINKALNDLAMEGLILRHVGRGTFVAGAGPARRIPAMAARRFAWIAPGVDKNDGKLLLTLAADLLQAKGHHMEGKDGQIDAYCELPDSVLSPRCLREIDGVLIFSARPSRALLANLRRRHLAVVLVNNYSPDVQVPTVLPGFSHGAFALTEKCIQLGHRTVQMLMPVESLPGSSAAQAGYEAAMQYYGLQALPATQIDARFDWSELLNGPNCPTALLCLSGRLAAEARRHAIEAGLSLPAELSIGAICSPGETCGERESITSCEFDPKRILHWAAEFITEGLSPHGPQTAVIPGRLVDRGSIVPPANRPGASASPRNEAKF